MTKFRRDLGLLEALGLSLSMISPTMAMSFSTTLAVQAAGVAAPVAFLIGAAAIAIVGLSFVALEKRIAGSGSVYAYIGHAFGPRWGFLAGWALLLTYLAATAGAIAMLGNYLMSFLAGFGLQGAHLWIVPSLAGMLTIFGLAFRDTRIAARVMLTLEALSVGAILFLAIRILTQVPLSTVPLHPSGAHAWAGVGYGMVFAILSFGGFEGAAMLGEETRNPKRAIPLAIMGTVTISGILFVIVMYAQVMGYGIEHVQALAQAESPLNALSSKFVSRPFAEFLDLATAVSAFACALASLSGAARMLYTLGTAGTSASWFGVLHPKHRTPARALFLVSAVSTLGLFVWGYPAGAVSYAGSIVTVGTLSLILVYMAVTGAELVEALRANRLLWVVLGFTGTVLLLWPLWVSLYPVPNWPDKLWPYVVIVWLILGAVQIFLGRQAARKSIAYDALNSAINRR